MSPRTPGPWAASTRPVALVEPRARGEKPQARRPSRDFRRDPLALGFEKVVDFLGAFVNPGRLLSSSPALLSQEREGGRGEESSEEKTLKGHSFPEDSVRRRFPCTAQALLAAAAGAGPRRPHHARAGRGLLSARTRKRRPSAPGSRARGRVLSAGRWRRDGAGDRAPARHGAGTDPRGRAGKPGRGGGCVRAPEAYAGLGLPRPRSSPPGGPQRPCSRARPQATAPGLGVPLAPGDAAGPRAGRLSCRPGSRAS